ncbi:Mut7-C RNAse domain-containing protein [Ostreiculturibacter nitratireducens]|uniref:Mut7-C RNAse domain-containing protein n=1 Tax=Ostreiculturibacter nitratireducens TaxID=3075226 RepID=UPI0031B59192
MGADGFLCDAMLGRLARWLRAAGHDALLADEESDDAKLLNVAANERRLLLTRDRRMAERNAARGRILVLRAETTEGQARELKRELGIDWLHAPFSRCVVDNTPLRPATEKETAALPAKVRTLGGPVRACPTCGRVYWTGDHHRRMRERLEDWNGDH